VILEKGVEDGQMLKIVNTAATALTITFAAVATSNVLGGTGVVVGQNQAAQFIYSVDLDAWMPQGITIAGATGTTQLAAGAVTGAKLSTLVNYSTVSKSTNGTTTVNVIAATVPFAATVTNVKVTALDTTAGNITVADTAGTITTIAKSTTAGVVTGTSSALTNTAIAAGNILTIVSSSAGNVIAEITLTVA
jgi:hypothetical protein